MLARLSPDGIAPAWRFEQLAFAHSLQLHHRVGDFKVAICY
jgi:hypothetical protein